MSDRFQTISMAQLTGWVFDELAAQGSIFGIPRQLFFVPRASDPFAQKLYGQNLETPIGVAAGPHSQLAQNIVVAWLCGARFMELKTVQTLDELEVSKPCIDMQDEGYNVEWSQELKVHESLEEYVRAWVLIHALHRKLGLPGETPGVIFNISVGYDLKGIQQPNVQWFLDAMADAATTRDRHVETISRWFPEVKEIPIPACVSDNVTLSTMHGCPPGEIGKISRYLIEERGLHTNVKLNPTLLGPERLRHILNVALGFRDVVVPDEAFGHDLKYPDAVELLRDLREAATRRGVVFGVKLSNTLEVENHRDVFDAKEPMMYLSGRPLQALTVNLAHKLSAEFEGDLLMSYAGGADAFNVANLLRTGMSTVTTCSDILKTGGYTRLLQYVENTAAAMEALGASSLEEFVRRSAGTSSWLVQTVGPAGPAGAPDAGNRAPGEDVRACALENLERYAAFVTTDRSLKQDSFERARTKTSRTLGLFDCIEAPCTDECPTDQKVPEYMSLVREGRFDEAVAVTRRDNPMAAVLGRACNHPCELVCIRTHYDEPLAIREIKRFIMEQEPGPEPARPADQSPGEVPVAVIGGGPCGLAVASYLTRAGFPVTVFEAQPYSGGMVSGTIPTYRATQEVIDQDLSYIQACGAEIRHGQKAGRDFTLSDLRRQGFEHVVVAAGAQRGMRLGIEGEDADGVIDGLELLRATREGRAPTLGPRVGVIGGGDVAMDCARTAQRLTSGEAIVIYRRTIDQMPTQREELQGLLEENIQIVELAAPQRVLLEAGKMTGLRCARMRLGDKDASGRRRPVEIPGSTIDIPLDTLIVAIGQHADLSFFGDEPIAVNRKGYIEVDADTMETSIANVYAGGDVVLEGPSTIVKAIGDGKRIAAAIQARVAPAEESPGPAAPGLDRVGLLKRRAHRQYRVEVPHIPPENRRGFEEIVSTFSQEEAVAEASRCLDCHVMCSLCVSVCPNLALLTYESEALEATLPTLQVKGGRLVRAGEREVAVRQALQVAVLTDFCNECGNCTTFCPTAGEPYRDKPRLYLRRSELEAQEDNAFLIERRNGAWAMRAKLGGELHELVLDETIHYSSPRMRATLDRSSLALLDAEPVADVGEGTTLSLQPCATMYILLESMRTSMPYLPTA